jgi:hypothetical protein
MAHDLVDGGEREVTKFFRKRIPALAWTTNGSK